MWKNEKQKKSKNLKRTCVWGYKIFFSDVKSFFFVDKISEGNRNSCKYCMILITENIS